MREEVQQHFERAADQFFREAFERRQQSDYEPVVEVDRETAQQMLDHALDFVDTGRHSIDK